MEGLTLHMEKTIMLPPATAKTDYFRPYGLKRSLTDLAVSARKRHDRVNLEARQNSRGNNVPVVSVQYDVPRTPPSPLMYRIRKLHTPQSGRPRSEDRITPVCSQVLEYQGQISLYDSIPEYPLKRSARIERRIEELKKWKQQDQVAVNVESQRLKGLGVGKCYSDYQPPPTAPESHHRQGFSPATPNLSNSRTSVRTSIMPSPISQSASLSRQGSMATPSQKPPSHDRAILKNAQVNAIKQITNIYNSRPKPKDKEIESKVKGQTQKSINAHHPTYMHSPMLFSQSHHPGNHEVRNVVHLNGEGYSYQYKGEGNNNLNKDEGRGYQYRIDNQGQNKGEGHVLQNKGEGHIHHYSSEVQGHLMKGEGQDVEQIYAAFRNVKNDYGSYLNEYNNSSSTPTVPYSTADILYGSEVNGGRGQQNDDARQNSFGELERSRDLARSRTKELEQNPNNKRPSSRSGKQKSLTIDSVTPFDKDREDPLRSLSSALPPAKPSHHFRANGIRSNIVKSEQVYSSKSNGAASGRDQDDLVAMGTLWSPNNNNSTSQQPPQVTSSSTLSSQQQQNASNKNNSVPNSNTNSYPSKGVSSSTSLSNNTLNSQRKYPGNNIRPIVVQNNVSGRKNSNTMKEQEDPKYTDPMIGAPASFQQRIIELGALEGDTVRWERSKRLKKKKQDRDS